MPLTKKFYYTKEELENMEQRSYANLKKFYEMLGKAIEDVKVDDIYSIIQINEIIGNANAILGACSHLRLCARERLKRRSV